MTRKTLPIALISIVGIIHLVLAPEYLEEKTYIGVLFLLGAAGCAVVAGLLARDAGDRRAWALGTLLSLGMGVGFILSRTTGLPGFHESEWELSGIATLIAEAAFIAMAVSRLAPARQRTPRAFADQRSFAQR